MSHLGQVACSAALDALVSYVERRYVTVTLPLHCRYITVTICAGFLRRAPVRYRYITVPLPLQYALVSYVERRYGQRVTSPSPNPPAPTPTPTLTPAQS